MNQATDKEQEVEENMGNSGNNQEKNIREKKKQEEQKNQETQQGTKLSETWAQDALGDLEDWIEEQGIYIRQ